MVRSVGCHAGDVFFLFFSLTRGVEEGKGEGGREGGREEVWITFMEEEEEAERKRK